MSDYCEHGNYASHCMDCDRRVHDDPTQQMKLVDHSEELSSLRARCERAERIAALAREFVKLDNECTRAVECLDGPAPLDALKAKFRELEAALDGAERGEAGK